jgi:hypothetical protein
MRSSIDILATLATDLGGNREASVRLNQSNSGRN